MNVDFMKCFFPGAVVAEDLYEHRIDVAHQAVYVALGAWAGGETGSFHEAPKGGEVAEVRPHKGLSPPGEGGGRVSWST